MSEQGNVVDIGTRQPRQEPSAVAEQPTVDAAAVKRAAGVALKWVGIALAVTAATAAFGGYFFGRRTGNKSCRLRATNRMFE